MKFKCLGHLQVLVSIGRNKQKFVEMVTPSEWTMKVMNDQFPVLTCDIVFCLSLRHLQVFDLRPPVPIAEACRRQSRNAACEFI
jgi:hypothetical protein